jgi:hypothetical protein
VAEGTDCSDYAYEYDRPWVANSDAIKCNTGLSILTWLYTFMVFRCVKGISETNTHYYLLIKLTP